MAKKSTGVYIVDKFNNPYELNEYHLFVQKECAKLKKKNIHIPGSGNTLVYIGELWQKKKAKEAIKAVSSISSTSTFSQAKKEDAALKQKLKRQPDTKANEKPLKAADAVAERIFQERAAFLAKEDERRYTIIQHSNTIISKFNAIANNNSSMKNFKGVQV